MKKASEKSQESHDPPATDHGIISGILGFFLKDDRDDDPDETYPPPDSDDLSLEDPDKEDVTPEKKSSPFGISGGAGLLKSDDFSALIGLDLSLGIPDKRARSEFYIGAAWAGVDRASELDTSIDGGVFLVSLGYHFKFKLSEDPQWHTPYFMVGGAYRRMWWDYENSILTSDGEVLYSDSLEGFELSAGFGKKLFKNNGGSTGIEVYPSVIFWFHNTTEGFENDVFDPFLMLNVRMVFSDW